jgi:hypothetical protein
LHAKGSHKNHAARSALEDLMQSVSTEQTGTNSPQCRRCGTEVARPPRGPNPRMCEECGAAHRDRAQVRYYLRSARRLAERSGDVVAAASLAEVLSDIGAAD